MQRDNLRQYWFLLKTFRNGVSLIQNCRHGGLMPHGPVASEAVLWNGTRLVHPHNRGGMVGTLLELWLHNAYRIGEFYTPRANDVIVDVGAHVGLFSVRLLQQHRGVRVACLEPSPENFACLERNVAAMGGGRIEIHQLAIGSQAGNVRMMELETSRSFDARTTGADEADPAAIRCVPMMALFELAKTERIALLKMDVEGGEHDAFESVDRDTLSRIDHIAMEYHDNLRPGTLALLTERMSETHTLSTFPTPGGGGHGMLFGQLRARGEAKRGGRRD